MCFTGNNADNQRLQKKTVTLTRRSPPRCDAMMRREKFVELLKKITLHILLEYHGPAPLDQPARSRPNKNSCSAARKKMQQRWLVLEGWCVGESQPPVCVAHRVPGSSSCNRNAGNISPKTLW